MMTYKKILQMANALGEDAFVSHSANRISVDFNDFDGFDENWLEIMRDYDNPEAVEAFQKMLKSEASWVDNGLYTTYHFNGFTVTVGYTSYDI